MQHSPNLSTSLCLTYDPNIPEGLLPSRRWLPLNQCRDVSSKM